MLNIMFIISACVLLLASPNATASVTPRIVAGSYHTVALASDGTVKTWGDNASGQLGDGTNFNSSIPLTVSVLGGKVIAISAGDTHTVAIRADGTVKAWGDNSSGQLGNGTTISSNTPVSVTGLEGAATDVAAGVYHTVALMANGTVNAWGNNSSGQLGNGTTSNSTLPVTTTGMGGAVTAIAAGGYHTVALMADGTVKTWGNNDYGQLGNGTTISSNTPVSVTGLGGAATAVAAGLLHTVVLMADGTVKTWGYNGHGQLGDTTTSDSTLPVMVAGTGGAVTAISAGCYHSLALMADGTVRAWGGNNHGELGDGSRISSSSPVTVIELGEPVAGITAGSSHSMALMSSGALKGWGYNSSGQLGDGTISSVIPVTVSGLTATRAVVAGDNHTVALSADGTVTTWGNNSNGELGADIPVTSFYAPIMVNGLDGPATAITAGSWHTVALLAGGTVKAWGDNSSGQLGNGTTISSNMPITVTGLGGAVSAIAAGGYHTVALMADGTVKAWGDNSSGQLGNGTTISSNMPVTVTGLGGAVSAIAAGGWHTVVLVTGGTMVQAWGYNSNGQLGDGSDTSSSLPVTVTGLEGTVSAIAAGSWHTVALISGGTTLKEWGDNSSGQLGDGTRTSSSVPVSVTGLGGAVSAISAGENHSVALMADGTVRAWGENSAGQLGNRKCVIQPTTALVYLDVTPPVIANELPAGSYGSSQTVTLICSDNFSGCSGIYYTDDNSTPTTASQFYTGPISVAANTILTIMAKDNAGNQSVFQSYTYKIAPGATTLTIIFSGSGSGTVAYSTGGGCTTFGGCSQSFSRGTAITITPAANGESLFTGWDNCPALSGDLCSVTLNGPATLTATFNLAAGTVVKVGGSYYGTVAGAISDVIDNGEISLKAGIIHEAVNFNRLLAATLKGGYNENFTTTSGMTTIAGSLTITAGTITIEGITIH